MSDLSPTHRAYLDLWYLALGSPIGIELACHKPDSARASLFNARAIAGEPALSVLLIRRNPRDPEGSLWIVKTGEVDLDALHKAAEALPKTYLDEITF